MDDANVLRFHRLKRELTRSVPGLSIRYKDETFFMKVLSRILFFNKGFHTLTATTIGKTIYFPSTEYVERNATYNALTILCHEVVHILDSNKNLFFTPLYFFPQILAPLAFLLIPYGWIIAVALFLFLCAPLPAYWRMKYEFRAYLVSLFISNEIFKERNLTEDDRRFRLEQAAKLYTKFFKNKQYYFAWPLASSIKFDEPIKKILSGDILNDDPIYGLVQDAFVASKSN